MKPTFESTVDILVKAYLNDTLEPGNYCGCAVGNLMAHAVSAKIIETDKDSCSRFRWKHPKYNGGEWYYDIHSDTAYTLINSTGYSFREIWRIEEAFEKARREQSFTNDDEIMFGGLMNVIDVLADIHKIDLKSKEEAKLLFVKP